MKRLVMGRLCAFVAVLAAAVSLAEDGLTARESWAGLKAHPAVVNPVGRAPDDPNVVSLRGNWDFKVGAKRTLKNRPGGRMPFGDEREWDPVRNPSGGPLRTIAVPGCWEWQGVGEPGTGMPCFVKWDVSPKPMRHVHSGDGWYRKRLVIPDSWRGKRIWLKTGWSNSLGFFWVNGRPVAFEDSYVGTYKYDVTPFVKPGETNTVVAMVTNDLPSRRGGMNSVHHWGGILRDVEFEATPTCFIDDAWVRGDFDKRCAEVRIEMGGEGGRRARVTIEGETVERAIEQSNNPTILTVPLRNFRAWSPEHPNLYWAKIELIEDGKVVQTRRERFGVRKLEVRGKEFYLNDKPFYFRGAGWHFIHPIEGAPLADREAWLAKARKVRAAGFNFVRTHTMCNMPEFFEACDEVGLMVQPELPYYTDVPRDGQAFDPLGDARELYRHYRRYPSFAVYSGGNEGLFGPFLTPRLYEEIRGRDPDRLVVGQDTWNNPHSNLPGTSDFSGGPMTVWPRGTIRCRQPFVCHEYLNLCVKLDSRLEKKYVGVYEPPVTRAARADGLAVFGLDLAWGDRLQDAQNRLQAVWRKYGLESARLDPECDGYSFWSLQDCASPQKGAYSAQAVFDPFWDVKSGGETPEEVAVYNSPSCVLLTDAEDPALWTDDPRRKVGKFDLFADRVATNRVRTAGERLNVRFHFAHFGETDLEDARLDWRLVANERVLASGETALGTVSIGPARVVGAADIIVPDIAEACRARFEARVSAPGFEQRNGWDYWLFPRRKRVRADAVACAAAFRGALSLRFDGLLDEDDWRRAKVIVAPFDSALEKAALAAGKKVVSLANQTGARDIFLGWWWMGRQMGGTISAHSSLRRVPHEGFLSPLFFRIGKTGLKLPIDGIGKDDLIMVGEGAEACFLYLAKSGGANGSVRFVVAGLDVLSDTPEGDALIQGIVEDLVLGK